MKTYIKYSGILILFLAMFSFAVPVLAQDPPPPPGHNDTGNVPGGGASLGGGLLILTALGAGYGYRKWQQGKKETDEIQ